MTINQIKNIIVNKYFILILLTFLAFCIRLLNIDKAYGLWNDEMLTYFFASKSFPLGIIKVFLKEDFHMPLYYLYLGGWMRILGTNDITLRLASVLWGTFTVPALFYLGKTYKSKKLGYLVAAIGCLSPIMIMFSQELRFYSMLVFFSTVSITFFLKLLDNPSKKKLILFSLTNLIILYTYIMGIVFVSMELLILTLHFYLYKKEFLTNYLKTSSVFFILSIPGIALIANSLATADQTLIDPIAWAVSSNSFLLPLVNDWFSPLFTCCYIQDLGRLTLLAGQHGITYVFLMSLPVLLFISGFIVNMKAKTEKNNYLLIIIGTFLLTEIILQILGHLVIVTKYTLILWPIIILICASGITDMKSKMTKCFILFIIFSVYVFNIINYKTADSFENRTGGFKYPANALMKLKPDGDYLLALERAELFQKYTKRLNYINFDAPGMLYLYKDKTAAYKIFNKQFVEKTNKHNAVKNLMPYLSSQQPTYELEQYLNKQINVIPKGKRLIYIEGPFYGSRTDLEYVNSFEQRYLNGMINSKNTQYELLCNTMEKINIDIKSVIKHNPSMIKTNEINLESPNPIVNKYVKYKISVYKKI